jgi:hypothetical protein
MAGKILDNGTLVTLGIVGVVAAVGAVAKRGSAARAGGESPVEVQRTLNAATRDLISVLKRGPGEIRHESDAMVTDETYSFTNINAAAIRAPGGWVPATYRSSYDRHTGMEDGDYMELGAAVPSAEAALLIAIEHELHGHVSEGAMARGGFNRKDRKGRKGSRSLSPRFAAAVDRGFKRAERMVDHEYEVQFDSAEGWYATNWIGLWATPAPGAIHTPSIAGPKVRDGFTASVYDADGDDHAVGVYPTASGALIGAMISVVMDTIQNTVSEEGYAQSLGN